MSRNFLTSGHLIYEPFEGQTDEGKTLFLQDYAVLRGSTFYVNVIHVGSHTEKRERWESSELQEDSVQRHCMS